MKWLLARFRAWYASLEEDCPRTKVPGYDCKGKVCDHVTEVKK